MLTAVRQRGMHPMAYLWEGGAWCNAPFGKVRKFGASSERPKSKSNSVGALHLASRPCSVPDPRPPSQKKYASEFGLS